MALDRRVADRFHRVLVEEIRRTPPGVPLEKPFTVAEIYQSLVPYRSHRDRIGVELNADYEEALLHLLGRVRGYLILDSQPARDRIRRELADRRTRTPGSSASLPPSRSASTPGRAGVAMESAPRSSSALPRRPPRTGRRRDPGRRTGRGAAGRRSRRPRPLPEPREEPAARPKASGRAAEGAPGALPSRRLPRLGPSRSGGPPLLPVLRHDVLVTSCGACGEELDRELGLLRGVREPSGGAGAVG
jgi:hypothetical protein